MITHKYIKEGTERGIERDTERKLYKYIDRTLIGFEFEFFVNDDNNLNAIIKNIKQILKRDVKTSKYNTDLQNDFIIVRDLSGGYFMYELITPPLDWWTSLTYLKFILDLIDKYGYTSDKSGLHVNMSIIDDDGNSIIVNPLFLAINLDLDVIKSLFKFSDGYQKIYKRPILAFHIHPLFFTESMLDEDFILNTLDINRHVVFPEMKYYEFNTKKVRSGIYEFRHIGGQDYHKKYEYIKNLIYYYLSVIVFTYEHRITDDKLQKLIGIFKSQYELKKKLSDPYKITNMDNIKFTVDLIDDPNYMYSYINQWFEPLFNVIMRYNNIDHLYINYDSQNKSIEIYNSDVNNNMVINNVVFINCNLDGIYTNSVIVNSDISYSILNNCDVVGSNIKSSKISNTLLKKCDISDCLITTRHKIVKDCTIDKSFINTKSFLLFKNDIKNSQIIYRDKKRVM